MPARQAPCSETERRWGQWLARIAMVAYFLALTGCSKTSPYPAATRVAPPAIPAYPNAQPGTLTDEQGRGRGRVTIFLTADASEVVQDYYRAELLRAGWQRDFGDDTTAFFANRQACPIYTLSVRTTRRNAQTVEVTISYGPEECDKG